MELALTFGSIGDIIQVSQLAIQLGRAIGLGCGAAGGESSREYLELRDDLDVFVRILMQVVATYHQHQHSPYLEGLDNVSRSVVSHCGSRIQEAIDHLQAKYHNSLRAGGSERKIRDICRKVEWALREREQLQCLRGKLSDATQRLSLLAGLAAEKSARIDNVTLLARVDQVEQLITRNCYGQENILDLLRENETLTTNQNTALEKLRQQLDGQEKNSGVILSTTRETQSTLTEVQNLVTQVSDYLRNSHVTTLHPNISYSLDPTRESPALLEDALGRHLPIPAEWLDCFTWELLGSLLYQKFRGNVGQDMVHRGEYVLEEGASGTDLNRSMPLCLRRGMRVHMSMTFEVFTTSPAGLQDCPRCGTTTHAMANVAVQCPKPECRMWFRTQKLQSNIPTKVQHLASEHDGIKEPLVVDPSTKPADFQRVRLLMYERAGSALSLKRLSYSLPSNMTPGFHEAISHIRVPRWIDDYKATSLYETMPSCIHTATWLDQQLKFGAQSCTSCGDFGLYHCARCHNPWLRVT